MITEPTWNECFKLFLEDRAKEIFALIHRYAIGPAADMAARYSAQSDSIEETPLDGKERLKDMLADGRVRVGDRVYVRKQPDRFATIVNGETVEYEGQEMPINSWGQLMTGWPSISIYDSVILERTGQALKNLRKEILTETV